MVAFGRLLAFVGPVGLVDEWSGRGLGAEGLGFVAGSGVRDRAGLWRSLVGVTRFPGWVEPVRFEAAVVRLTAVFTVAESVVRGLAPGSSVGRGVAALARLLASALGRPRTDDPSTPPAALPDGHELYSPSPPIGISVAASTAAANRRR